MYKHKVDDIVYGNCFKLHEMRGAAVVATTRFHKQAAHVGTRTVRRAPLFPGPKRKTHEIKPATYIAAIVIACR